MQGDRIISMEEVKEIISICLPKDKLLEAVSFIANNFLLQDKTTMYEDGYMLSHYDAQRLKNQLMHGIIKQTQQFGRLE